MTPFLIRPCLTPGRYEVVDIRTGQVRFAGDLGSARQIAASLNYGSLR